MSRSETVAPWLFPQFDAHSQVENKTSFSINGFLLNLLPEQVLAAEKTLQADLNYKPGLTAVLHVPLYKTPGLPINPIQVAEYPLYETDADPINRAIATIGEESTCWKLLHDIFHTGEGDFYNLKSFGVLPVYIDENGNKVVKILPPRPNGTQFDQSPKRARVQIITRGGDGDFTGSSMSPPNGVPFHLYSGKYVTMPYEQIGLPPGIGKELLDSSIKVRKCQEKEIAQIVMSNYSELPVSIQKTVDFALSSSPGLTSVAVYKAHFEAFARGESVDFAACDKAIAHIGHLVNNCFRKQIDESPTMNAIHDYCSFLQNMYQKAYTFYRP